MKRTRISRILGLTTTAVLLLAVVGLSPAAAKTPSGWGVSAVLLPDTVKPGNDAGYRVTISNVGPSNINAVTFSAVPTDTPNATPSYFSGLPGYTCSTSGQLTCNLGTLVAGTTLTLTVAYEVPLTSSGTFDVTFKLLAATGDVSGSNQSRGDAYQILYSTALDSTADFDGGFVLDDLTYATTGTLGRGNKQNSAVDITGTALTAMIRDRITDNLCDGKTISNCANQIGEWTRLNVPDNQGYLKVTLDIFGGAVPGGATASNIFLIHVLDGTAGIQYIGLNGARCADADTAPASGECIAVTKVGSNFRIVGWLLENGGLRGGY
ncbi:MAG TPA: hypothetical protein VHR16_09370 [Candidatus Limnocylindrales bacterium]|nr:hypothetical protein [Candidatus Limnocylindrales bacterium]